MPPQQQALFVGRNRMRHLLLIIIVIVATFGCSTNSSYNKESAVADKDSLPKDGIVGRS